MKTRFLFAFLGLSSGAIVGVASGCGNTVIEVGPNGMPIGTSTSASLTCDPNLETGSPATCYGAAIGPYAWAKSVIMTREAESGYVWIDISSGEAGDCADPEAIQKPCAAGEMLTIHLPPGHQAVGVHDLSTSDGDFVEVNDRSAGNCAMGGGYPNGTLTITAFDSSHVAGFLCGSGQWDGSFSASFCCGSCHQGGGPCTKDADCCTSFCELDANNPNLQGTCSA